MMILAILPIAILVIPTSPLSQRVGVAATILATFLVVHLVALMLRRRDARNAARRAEFG